MLERWYPWGWAPNVFAIGNIMGSSAKVVNTQAELDSWAENPAVQAMPSYPANGCIAMVDGAAVIKLSD